MKNKQIERSSLPMGTLSFACMIAGLIASMVCGMRTVEEGLELLFLLPLAFTICAVVFYRAFSYWRENVAFVIIFATIAVRYLATPVLMTLSGTALTTVHPTPDYYRLAIIIQIFELVAILTVIDFVWTRHKKKLEQAGISNKPVTVDFKLSWTGAVFLVGLAGLVLVRGHIPDLVERYSTWWHISEDFSAVFFYDYISVEIIKSVLGVILVAFFAKCFRRTKSMLDKFVYYLLATFAGMAMTMIYMYDQRTSLVQLILSSMIIILAFFPKLKKLTLVIFGVGGGFMVAYVFASGSMGYELGGSNVSSLADMSKMAELYVSGPSMVAITQQKYDWVRENMRLATYASDIINTSHIFGMFPFLRGILGLVANIPTSNMLFVESLGGLTYILPNYSLWTYYATDILGWLFEILSMYAVIRVVCFVDGKKKKVSDACYYYAWAYVETLLGQAIFVNNTFLLWHAFTNLPMWLLVFAWVNSIGNKVKFKV